MDRQTDVRPVGQGGVTAMDADPDLDRALAGPRLVPHPALDHDRGVERRRRGGEHAQELVGVDLDLVSAGLADLLADDSSDVGQHGAVVVAQLGQEGGRGLDIGHQEGDRAGGEGRRALCPRVRLAPRPLLAELALDEADRDEAVPARRAEELGPGLLAGGIRLEDDLVEATQRRADVGLVEDGQQPLPLGVDVGEGALRHLRPLRVAELGHRPIVRGRPARGRPACGGRVLRGRGSRSPGAWRRIRGGRGGG